MKTLSDCLSTNKKLLGDHYSKLGVAEGKGLFKHKVLLSYDKKTGWDVLRLNFIQLLFRKLGFYRSTRLENIHQAWVGLKLMDRPFVDSDLDKKIVDLCKRHLLIALGSADLSDAEIICFAEANHTDRVFRHTMALLIAQHYQKSDVILVEGYKAGKVLTSWQKEADRSFAKADQIAQGWDLVDRQKPDFLIRWEQQVSKLVQLPHRVICTNPLLDEVREGADFFLEIEKAEKQLEKEPSDENLAHLEKVIEQTFKNAKEVNSLSTQRYTGTTFKRIRAWSDDLLKDYNELATFFNEKHDPETINRKIQTVIKEKENQQETNPDCGEQCVKLLKLLILAMAKQLMETSDKAIYKGATGKDVAEMLKTFESRQISLCRQISLLKQQGVKHIFVQAGSLHLLFNKITPRNGVKIVKDTLKQHKFIIITSKKPFIKQRIAAINPELARRSLV